MYEYRLTLIFSIFKEIQSTEYNNKVNKSGK